MRCYGTDDLLDFSMVANSHFRRLLPDEQEDLISHDHPPGDGHGR